jgi:metalloendopeptidase OMA1, mitochondrial
VGLAIAGAADEPSFEWDVVLIESPEINAWCLPGGKMGVYTGILPVTQSDEGLAVVMGHEVAHAVSHHGGRRVSEALGYEMVAAILDAGLSGTSAATRELALRSFGVSTTLMGSLPFSRSDESEADHIGLILMAKAGYDPREGPRLWQRMMQMAGGSGMPEFLSTHPNPETRIKDMEAWMPDALQHYEASGKAPGKAPAVKSPEVKAPPLPKKKAVPTSGGI